MFRIISDIRCKYWVDTTPFPIGTNHHDANLSSLNQRGQQRLHALVKEAIPLNGAVLLVETLKLRDWEVSKEDSRMF